MCRLSQPFRTTTTFAQSAEFSAPNPPSDLWDDGHKVSVRKLVWFTSISRTPEVSKQGSGTLQLPRIPGLEGGIHSETPLSAFSEHLPSTSMVDQENVAVQGSEGAQLTQELEKLSTPIENNLYMGSKLGTGASSDVYSAWDISSGRTVAIKIVPLSSLAALRLVEAEVTAFQALPPHPNIITFDGIEILQPRGGQVLPRAMLQLRFATGGSLSQLAQRSGGLTQKLIKRVGRDVLTALAHCHQHGVIHHDVKGANILLDAQGCAMLADFGSAATIVSHAEDVSPQTNQAAFRGTVAFMAPELSHTSVSTSNLPKSDVWSFACLVVELLTGKPPWSTETSGAELMMAIASCEDGSLIPKDCPPLLAASLQQCFVKNPEHRASAQELLDEGFFSLQSFESLEKQHNSQLCRALKQCVLENLMKARVGRIMDVLAYASDENLTSRSASWTARSCLQQSHMYCLLNLTDIRRATLLMRSYAANACDVVDDILWGLQDLWPHWGDEADLLRHAAVLNFDCAAEPEQRECDMYGYAFVAVAVDTMRASIKTQDAEAAIQAVQQALASICSAWLHASTPVPDPLLPLPNLTEVYEDIDGYEVVNEEAGGVHVPSQLHCGILLRWLSEARHSLARKTKETRHAHKCVISRFGCIFGVWRHCHHLALALQDAISAMQAILLACSSISKHMERSTEDQVVSLKLPDLLKAISASAVAVLSRAMHLHNQACMLHQGTWYRAKTDALTAFVIQCHSEVQFSGDDHLDLYAVEPSEFADESADQAPLTASVAQPEPATDQVAFAESDSEFEGMEDGENLVAMALADYEACSETELSFQEGDLLLVFQQHESGWWHGECNDSSGWFPSNYVAVQHTLYPIYEDGDEMFFDQ